METMIMIMVWLVVIMLFGFTVAAFGFFCYFIYEGIKYLYEQVVDFIESRKDEKRMREARKEYWKNLEEEEKKKAEIEMKGKFVYAN